LFDFGSLLKVAGSLACFFLESPLETKKEPASHSRTHLWPLGLLGIGFLVSALCSKRSKSSDFTHPQIDASKKAAEIPPSIAYSEAIPIPAKNSDCEDNRRRQTPIPWWEKGSALAQICIALVTVGLLCVNLSQSRSTERAAKSARDSADTASETMHIDERAWLKFELGGKSVSSLDPTARVRSFSVREGSPLSIPVRFTNVGKTAAQKIRAFVFIEVVPIGKEPNTPEVSQRIMFGYQGEVPTHPADVIVRAAHPMEASIVWASDFLERPYRRRTIIGNQVVDFPLQRGEIIELLTSKSYLAIYGEVKYSDVFKVEHWTRFCTSRLINDEPTESEKCARYSGVDNNTK
jgi:hypothetical protein